MELEPLELTWHFFARPCVLFSVLDCGSRRRLFLTVRAGAGEVSTDDYDTDLFLVDGRRFVVVLNSLL